MRLIFGIGIGFDCNGKAIPPSESAKLVREAILHTTHIFGGCFVQRGEGAWLNGDELVIELGITLTVESERSDLAHDHAEWLRGLFNQNCVVLSVIDSHASFVSKELLHS